MDASTPATACIAAPEWFWFRLLLLLWFTLPVAPSQSTLSTLTCLGHHIWGVIQDPDSSLWTARREQERRPRRHVKKEGRNQRALDGLKNDASTDSLRLATRCSQMLSAKVKNMTRNRTDLDWENEEDFDVLDDRMRRYERG